MTLPRWDIVSNPKPDQAADGRTVFHSGLWRTSRFLYLLAVTPLQWNIQPKLF